MHGKRFLMIWSMYCSMIVPQRCIVQHVMCFGVPTYGLCLRDEGFHPDRNLMENHIRLSQAIAYPRIGLNDTATFGV